jgi:hypothetical protein
MQNIMSKKKKYYIYKKDNAEPLELPETIVPLLKLFDKVGVGYLDWIDGEKELQPEKFFEQFKTAVDRTFDYVYDMETYKSELIRVAKEVELEIKERDNGTNSKGLSEDSDNDN